jgi:hypothetical protein
MAAVRVWDKKKLVAMRDTYLPESTSITDALRKISIKDKVNYKLSSFRIGFKAEFGVPPSTFLAKEYEEPDVPPQDNPVVLQRRIAVLEKELRKAAEESNSVRVVRSLCHAGMEYKPSQPEWCTRVPSVKSELFHGAPTLFLSDWHHGETVFRSQVNGANEFNIEVSGKRARRVFERTAMVLQSVFANPVYPGIVVPLGGDMVSGNIHEELRETNDVPIFQAVLDCVDILEAGLRLLQREFGKVYVPCVVGNHGRLDRKPRCKHGPQDNYDYILYHLLAARFHGNDDVTVHVAESFTMHYRMYGVRYLLTHGDQFKGGSGIAGSITPWTLGDHKLRKQMSTMSAWTKQPTEYDVLLMGHFHQYFPARTFLVNGCFPPGSQVTLEDGTRKAIETVKVGEHVAARTGVYPVVDTFVREHIGQLVNLRLGSAESDIKCTPNHEIFAVKAQELGAKRPHKGSSYVPGSYTPQPRWIAAQYLSAGDYVQIAMTPGEEVFDPDLAWLYGMYLAEGSVSGPRNREGVRTLQHVDFTHHIKETDFADRAQSLCIKFFGKAVQAERKDKTTRSVVVHSKETAEHFADLFGTGAANKRIPSHVMRVDPQTQLHLLIGWLQGDGHVATQSYRGGRYVSGCSISYDLICQLQQIAVRSGFNPTIYALAAGGRRKSKAYTLGFTGDDAARIAQLLHLEKPYHNVRDNEWSTITVEGRVYRRVTHVWREDYLGPVYNLTVDQDHSYAVSGITVKNSLKGFDEYAKRSGFAFEPAQQALWFTNPEYGMTFNTSIFGEDPGKTGKDSTQWVSLPAKE